MVGGFTEEPESVIIVPGETTDGGLGTPGEAVGSGSILGKPVKMWKIFDLGTNGEVETSYWIITSCWLQSCAVIVSDRWNISKSWIGALEFAVSL